MCCFHHTAGVKLSTGQEILTNLVIVADGRRSQLPHWLKTEAGIALPPPKKVDGKTLYAARWMLLPEDYDMDKEWTSIVIMGRPHLSKGGLALPAEGRLIQVSLVGMMGQRPPIDEKGYMAYAKSLPDPALYELMQRCTPVSKSMLDWLLCFGVFSLECGTFSLLFIHPMNPKLKLRFLT